jgi:hypothetical protein
MHGSRVIGKDTFATTGNIDLKCAGKQLLQSLAGFRRGNQVKPPGLFPQAGQLSIVDENRRRIGGGGPIDKVVHFSV